MHYKLLVRALLELGCNVAAFCPEPYEVKTELHDLSRDTQSGLTTHRFSNVPTVSFLPYRVKYRLATLLTTLKLSGALLQWEIRMRRKLDLVFFASMYDDHFSRRPEAALMFPFPWSGLYIYSGRFRKLLPDASWSDLPPWLATLLRSRRLKSIVVLDAGVTEMMEKLCERPVIAFPDLTDERLAPNSQIASELKKFAAGRPIVGLFGFLKPTKGTMILAKLALDPANSDLCFAFIGELGNYGYTAEEHEVISTLAARRPNVFSHFGRIQDEREFNRCFQAVDVIFAAYLDFADSSGILTKAAVFQKPVIVSDGYLMAERVRKHRLGAVIAPGNVEVAGSAIRSVLLQEKSVPASPDWEGYCEEHSYQRLKTAFSKVLATI
jgi:hypothetical protein